MMFIHPNESPKKNKTYVNGKLLKEDTPLKNGDRILFGNHNMYIVQFPDEKVPIEGFDYQSAMAEVMQDQMKGLKDENLE